MSLRLSQGKNGDYQLPASEENRRAIQPPITREPKSSDKEESNEAISVSIGKQILPVLHCVGMCLKEERQILTNPNPPKYVSLLS